MYQTYDFNDVNYQCHYCEDEDITFVTKMNDDLDSCQVYQTIGYYYGEPNEYDTLYVVEN